MAGEKACTTVLVFDPVGNTTNSRNSNRGDGRKARCNIID